MKKLRCIVFAFALIVVGGWNFASFGQDASVTSPADIDSVVESYKKTADRIIAAGRKGNDSYLKLQELCDDIGNRLSGSESLEKAIGWAQESLKKDGQENVRAEKVTIRKWVRGNESCQLVLPRPLKFDMLGWAVRSELPRKESQPKSLSSIAKKNWTRYPMNKSKARSSSSMPRCQCSPKRMVLDMVPQFNTVPTEQSGRLSAVAWRHWSDR